MSQPPQRPTLSRPTRQDGTKHKLTAVFETHKEQFAQANCEVYGHVEPASSLVLNLLWKPLTAPLRFVFARTSRGPLGLMCSDLAMEPLVAISLYCACVRIATMFAMLKSVLGAFACRFWSKRLPRHSPKPKRNASLKAPQKEHLETVQKTWQAGERFVMLGCITFGLLPLVPLKFQDQVWGACRLFLRTRSRALPSERTVKEVLAQELVWNCRKVASWAILPLMTPEEYPPEPWTHSTPSSEPAKAVNA